MVNTVQDLGLSIYNTPSGLANHQLQIEQAGVQRKSLELESIPQNRLRRQRPWLKQSQS